MGKSLALMWLDKTLPKLGNHYRQFPFPNGCSRWRYFLPILLELFEMPLTKIPLSFNFVTDKSDLVVTLVLVKFIITLVAFCRLKWFVGMSVFSLYVSHSQRKWWWSKQEKRGCLFLASFGGVIGGGVCMFVHVDSWCQLDACVFHLYFPVITPG